MRLRLDPWAIDYGTAMHAELEPSHERDLDLSVEVDTDSWRPVRPSAAQAFEQVVFLDGVRRLEARLLLEDEEAQLAYGALASCAVGAVLCSHSAAAAEFVDAWRVRRLLAISNDQRTPDLRLEAAGDSLGDLEYRVLVSAESDVDAVVRLVQSAMLEEERDLARHLLERLPGALVLCDGSRPLVGAQARAVGYLKTVHELKLSGRPLAIVRRLEQGERSPIYLVKTRDPEGQYFEWFLRLRDPRPWLYTLAGTVRLQAFAGRDPAGQLPWARRVADWSCRELPRFTSRPHEDPRAPQQLLPIRALEGELRRRMGDAELVRRRLTRRLGVEMIGAKAERSEA